MREGANALLPLAQIGGDFIGARCLALRGMRGSLAAASVIVDVLMQAVSQLVFAIIGLILLMSIGGNELIVWPVAVGIALALPALGGFLLVQGEFGQRLVNKLLALFAGDRNWLAFGAVNDLFERLSEFYANRRRLIRSVVWHLAGWFVGAIEVWVVLKFMGYQVDFGDAVIIESLMHAVRGAAFAVPGALGAQEGGLIVLCAIFGVPPKRRWRCRWSSGFPTWSSECRASWHGRPWRAGLFTGAGAPLGIRMSGPDRPMTAP